ncbi:MAG TPA: MerR family transcriptional regulator [Planctomycetota bacterium]|nr:MerR family transcriptional regulator [Planctomycetota bacterium]
MSRVPVAAGAPPTTKDETFDIEQASKACGLSAGVLRMWELRYGWPRPGRLPNGYRYFTRYQIDDLKRMSALVKSGMLISRLIQDGMPKWPQDANHDPNAHIVTLEAALALPKPRSATGQEIRTHLLDALRTHNQGRAWEMLLRCSWEVHPNEQVLVGWLPTVVALDEYRQKSRPFSGADTLRTLIRDQVRDAFARQAPESRPLWVVPITGEDHSLAYTAAAVLCVRGLVARPWLWDRLPANARFVSIGTQAPEPGRYPGEQHLRHFTVIEQGDVPGLTGLANDKRDVSWLAAAASA